MTSSIKKQIAALKESPEISDLTYRKARAIYINGNCQVLSQSVRGFDILVFDEGEEDVEIRIAIDEDENLRYLIKGKPAPWDSFGIAALMQIDEESEKTEPRPFLEGKAYTREGMVKRVLEERKAKALKAKYTIKFADNIYGEHLLTTEKGVNYKITLRDFENETGYIDNPDLKTNKLGTTKHLMFAFAELKSKPAVYNSLSKFYPFVEIYLDPLNDYRITWHYPHHLRPEIAALITRYFGSKNYIEENAEKDFLNFIIDAREHQHILVRPEVDEKVKKAWDLEMLALAKKEEQLDFSLLKTTLFPYQQEGVAFAAFRDGAIIADEMGLGKTIQAIATAVMKKKLFGFRRTLIICPASLKEQWKQEIEKFSHENAVIADGPPEQRAETYRKSDAYFVIVNYET
ncbi:MAG: SNF2-related protein, partial [Sphingobacteriales bacterium]